MAGRKSILSRKWRQVNKETKVRNECRLCNRDLHTLLNERQVGRVDPCGCHFCFTGGGECMGIYNFFMGAVVYDLKPRVDQCPGCQSRGTQVSRVGPTGVVETDTLPFDMAPQEKVELKRHDPSEWGTKQLVALPQAKKLPAQVRQEQLETQQLVHDEELFERSDIKYTLKSTGLVALLDDPQQCAHLELYLKNAHGVRKATNGTKWFTPSHLSDISQHPNGTLGLLAHARFSVVAQCCGGSGTVQLEGFHGVGLSA